MIEGGIGEREAGVLELLRSRPLAPIPRAVLGGSAIGRLRESGLIERSPFPGLWQITALGRDIDIPELLSRQSSSRASPSGYSYGWEPVGQDRRDLAEAWLAIDHLRPGSALFGCEVRQSAMDYLEGMSRARKFIYFAYPLGYPGNHIAWAAREDHPKWTGHTIFIERNKVGLPAMRSTKERWEVYRYRKTAEADLRQRLLDEGNTPDEIREYFALLASGDVL